MTDLLTLANSIKTTKEEIRQKLLARGITCPANEKFSNYPAKIDALGRIPGTGDLSNEAEVLTVKNNAGKTLVPGDKVVLYCSQDVEEATKITFPYASNTCYVSRSGNEIFNPQTRRLLDVATGNVRITGPVSNNHDITYYLDNNVMAASYEWITTFLFPIQMTVQNLKPVRHKYFICDEGSNVHKLATIDLSTGALTKYEGNCFFTSTNYSGSHFILGNTLYARAVSSGNMCKFTIDDQNLELKDRTECTGGVDIQYNRLIGITSDDKYVLFTNRANYCGYLTIYKNNNGTLEAIPTMNYMCPELNPFYQINERCYRFSFNEYTNNLCINSDWTGLKVFHYNNDKFELILDRQISELYYYDEVTISDNLNVMAQTSGTLYKMPSVLVGTYEAHDAQYVVSNPNLFTGIVKEGGVVGANVKVVIPRLPETTLTLTTDVNNATIEQF